MISDNYRITGAVPVISTMDGVLFRISIQNQLITGTGLTNILYIKIRILETLEYISIKAFWKKYPKKVESFS